MQDAREAVALILQAKAEVEARRVLTAIGLTEQQSRLFLQLNASAPLAATVAALPGDQLPAQNGASPARVDRDSKAEGGEGGAEAGVVTGLGEGLGQVGASGGGNVSRGNVSRNVSRDLSAITSYLKAWEKEVSARYVETLDVTSDGMASWQGVWESIYGVASNSTSRVSAPAEPIRSLRFLDQVKSQVAINPAIFTLLRDAAELTLLKDIIYKDSALMAASLKSEEGAESARATTINSELKAVAATAVSNLSVALTRRLEDDVSPYVKTVDASFNSLVDQVENTLAESMRTLYYTPAGRPRQTFTGDGEAGDDDSAVQKLTQMLDERVLGRVHRVALPVFEWGFQAIAQARASWAEGECCAAHCCLAWRAPRSAPRVSPAAAARCSLLLRRACLPPR